MANPADAVGREQVLCLLPHQDDEFAIFAEIEAAVAAGNRVTCVYLTDGAFGGQSIERREAESQRVLSALGVAREDVHWLGSQLGIADRALFRRVIEATEAIRRVLVQTGDRWRILMPAWEGGHHDHDAAHLMGLLLAQGLGPSASAHQFSIYHGYPLPGPFFRVLSPLRENGPVLERSVPWAKRLRYLRYCLSYPSQWKTWIGLFPGVLANYIAVGTQRLQPVDPSRVQEPPHSGRVLYERRGFCTWSTFAEVTRSIREAIASPPS